MAVFVHLLFILIATASVKAVHFPVKTYTVADGLLRDSVYRIKQDSQGFLWLCTPEGISRFDGYGFTNFTTDDGLPDRHVNDFLQTADGTIYLATDGGLVRLEPTGTPRSSENPLFTVFRPPDEPTAKFQVLVENANGEILCGTTDGVFTFDGKVFAKSEFGGAAGIIDVTDLKRTAKGQVWAGTGSNGLFWSNDGKHFRAGPALPEDDVPSITEDTDGSLWVGLRPGKVGGICHINIAGDGRSVKCYTPRDGLPSGWVSSILRLRDGELWVGTTKGICRWQNDGGGSVCRAFTPNNDICNAEIWDLIQDKDQNIWAGTRCGLKKVGHGGFSYFNEDDGLGRGLINSVFEDQAGDLFTSIILPQGRQISRLAGDEFQSAMPRLEHRLEYFGWGWKQTVLHDTSGAWWVATGAGIFRSPANTGFDDLTKIVLKQTEFPPNDHEAFRIFEDSSSNVWVAGAGQHVGLWCWERKANQWHDYTHEAGIGFTRLVTAFVEDAGHNLWIATGSDSDDTGLIEFRGGQFRVFSRQTNDLIRGWLRDEYIDDKGRLWLASTSTGLLRIDDPNADRFEIARYGTKDGLSSTGVYCVTEDSDGAIYAGTGRGVDRLDPASGAVENFTTFDGLPDSDVEICYRDRSNVLWFGTSRGLARYLPQPRRSRQAPTVLITGVRVNGSPQRVSLLGESQLRDLDLDPFQRGVSVDFVGLGATLGEKLRYEYKLNDADWLPTTERTLNFADVQSGAYSLAIRAVTRDSIVTDAPALLRFRIAAPIWQRWWFIVAVALVGAAIVYIVYRSRLTKLLELERTRTRIATDLHDDIGANLSKIALLSELVKMKLTNGNEENNRMLATIADVSRSTVDSMRDIVWSINPRRDSVLEMTRRMREHAEETLVPLGISVEFKTDESGRDHTLPMDMRRDLLLIFKEAINNAARHSNCRNVHIDFRAGGSSLFLLVTDDGGGFDLAVTQENNGLANMRARAEKIGARFSIDSRAGSGTTITVEAGGSDLRN